MSGLLLEMVEPDGVGTGVRLENLSRQGVGIAGTGQILARHGCRAGLGTERRAAAIRGVISSRLLAVALAAK